MECPCPPLMGIETEYAISVFDHGKLNPRDADMSASRLLEAAMERFPFLMSADGQGVFLANGGKLYIDVGAHPEYGSPECACPTDIVRYTLAGDRMMSQIAEGLKKEGVSRAYVFGATPGTATARRGVAMSRISAATRRAATSMAWCRSWRRGSFTAEAAASIHFIQASRSVFRLDHTLSLKLLTLKR